MSTLPSTCSTIIRMVPTSAKKSSPGIARVIDSRIDSPGRYITSSQESNAFVNSDAFLFSWPVHEAVEAKKREHGDRDQAEFEGRD